MKIPFDDQAQPTLHSRKDTVRLNERKIDEMIGICKGIISDKIINQKEADFLSKWLTNNAKIAHRWPAIILYQRINKMLKDGLLDQGEKTELFDTLRKVTGETSEISSTNMATKLPLTDPPPTVIFNKQNYCFTGHFVNGTRKQVEAIVIDRGGNTQERPTFDTNYLVIGELGSADWIHSTFGRKIEKAMDIKKSCAIKIISEEYWSQFV